MSKQKPLQLTDLSVDYMSILSTQSKTFDCDAMVYEALRQVEQIKGIDWEFDAYGNLYVTKGNADTYPAFVCHMDTVHLLRKDFRAHYDDRGYFYATTGDDGEFVQVGIGGDDKCGIILCIELLTKLKNVKCAFFLDEEQGCKGSSAARMDFFDDCRFAIQIDRKGGGDIITVGSGTELCSEDFKTLLNEVGANYDYKSTWGANTDVVKLKDNGLKISAVNLSAGYYNPHTKQEYIKVSELLNCLQFCKTIAMFKTVYPHVPEKKSQAVTQPQGRYAGACTPYNNTQYNGGSWMRDKSYIGKKPDRDCAECGETLSFQEMEQRVHNHCIQKFLASEVEDTKKNRGEPQRTLDVNDDGTRILFTDEAPVLPPLFDDKLPSELCLLCEIALVHDKEKKRGFCESCLYCRCGELIETTTELVAKECYKCIDSRGAQLCSTRGCAKELKTAIELTDGTCESCRSLMYLAYE